MFLEIEATTAQEDKLLFSQSFKLTDFTGTDGLEVPHVYTASMLDSPEQRDLTACYQGDRFVIALVLNCTDEDGIYVKVRKVHHTFTDIDCADVAVDIESIKARLVSKPSYGSLPLHREPESRRMRLLKNMAGFVFKYTAQMVTGKRPTAEK